MPNNAMPCGAQPQAFGSALLRVVAAEGLVELTRSELADAVRCHGRAAVERAAFEVLTEAYPNAAPEEILAAVQADARRLIGGAQ